MTNLQYKRMTDKADMPSYEGRNKNTDRTFLISAVALSGLSSAASRAGYSVRTLFRIHAGLLVNVKKPRFNRKRHLKAVSTPRLTVSKVMSVTSSSGDHFDDRDRGCREPQGQAELHA
jgi:hypothetical protein